MATKQEYRVSVGNRVRIKDSVTHMYPRARAYSEGWVRARQHDGLGYPVFYMEWDKDHWAYSGEQDRWVDEAHFDLVEEQMAEDKRFDELLGGLSDLVSSFRDNDEGPENTEEKPPAKDPRPDRELTYEEVLRKAIEDATQGDAFIVLVAKPEEFNGAEIVVPHVYLHSRREDAAMMLDATMADAAAVAHARLVVRMIEQAKRDGASS